MKKNITREHKMIRRARKRRGFSQQQVATLLGAPIRQYQRLEYGESDVMRLGMKKGLSLCIVLGLDPYNLIFGATPNAVEALIKQAENLRQGKVAFDMQGPPADTGKST